MNITKKYHGVSGVDYIFEYSDADSFDHLDPSQCRQTYGVCFFKDKIIVVYHGKKGTWGLVGGTVEPGETLEQTLKREIQEESNMEVLNFLPIGIQKVIDTRDKSFFYQLRYVCTTRPYGPFISDPDGNITEIKLIDPLKYKDYFNWNKIREQIISRAIELKPKLN